jgi:hypothetical protein
MFGPKLEFCYLTDSNGNGFLSVEMDGQVYSQPRTGDEMAYAKKRRNIDGGRQRSQCPTILETLALSFFLN